MIQSNHSEKIEVKFLSNYKNEVTEEKHYVELGIVAFLSLLPILVIIAKTLLVTFGTVNT
ncbi:hypothetical protein FACS1894193_02440 [Bacilli bacterium]|nr:hypothetical protein FACS1894192_10490 [Bacilli bacterium]GHU40339.1 hypothetical protein FACS1894193_02440 [Bacilli bacterium]